MEIITIKPSSVIPAEELDQQYSTPKIPGEVEKFVFSVSVTCPVDAIVEINGIRTDSVLVEKFEVVHWKVSKKGYKTSLGEFQILNSVRLVLSLKQDKPKKPKKDDSPYTKISVNDYMGYDYEKFELATDKIPDTQYKDKHFLYTIDEYLFWKKVTPEDVFETKIEDEGKYLTYTQSGFIWKDVREEFPEQKILPEKPAFGRYLLESKDSVLGWKKEPSYDLPEAPYLIPVEKDEIDINSGDYIEKEEPNEDNLIVGSDNIISIENPNQVVEVENKTEEYPLYYMVYSNGMAIWTTIKDPTIEEIKGDFNKNESFRSVIVPIKEDIFYIQRNINEINEIISKMGKNVDCIPNMKDNITSLQGIVIVLDKKVEQLMPLLSKIEEIDKLIQEVKDLKAEVLAIIARQEKVITEINSRQKIFEEWTVNNFAARMTPPDFTQITNPTLDSNNMFYLANNKYGLVNSNTVGDVLEVYKAIHSETDYSVVYPDFTTGVILTYFRNNTGVNCLQNIILPKDYFYKISNPISMNVKLIGELPYGKLPE